MPHPCQAGNSCYYQHKQRGAVLMVMLVIMIMGSAVFLVSSLSRVGLQIERASKTSDVLAQAKDALIAYAVSNATRPGNLPCPDLNAPGEPGYGDEEPSCSTGGGTSIGRLPWKSLGIPELVDADGEPLWYAISDNFRNNAPVINSDTQGTLSVYDADGTTLLTPSGSEAVAIVFSPGAIVGSQQRNSITDKKDKSNYLDSYTFPAPISVTRNNATTIGPFIKGIVKDASDNTKINDRLIYITTDQLFPAIEKRVGKEIENGIKPMLNAYYVAWGAFPFAAPFTQPSVSPFTGQAPTYDGLLPIGNITNITTPSPQWKTSPAPHYFINGVDTGICTFGTSNTKLRCGNNSSPYTSVPEGATITFTGVLNGIGFGLWQPHDVTNTAQVSVKNIGGSYVLASTMLANPTITTSLNLDGSANITFTGQGITGGTTLRRVQLSNAIASSSTASLSTWLLSSTANWHQLMYYAVSPGYAPGGINSCEPLGTLPHIKPYCLTVNGSGGGNDKRVVVVMMNKALTGKTNRTNTPADYLEGENATPADFIYENKNRASDFNDQVIIVAP